MSYAQWEFINLDISQSHRNWVEDWNNVAVSSPPICYLDILAPFLSNTRKGQGIGNPCLLQQFCWWASWVEGDIQTSRQTRFEEPLRTEWNLQPHITDHRQYRHCHLWTGCGEMTRLSQLIDDYCLHSHCQELFHWTLWWQNDRADRKGREKSLKKGPWDGTKDGTRKHQQPGRPHRLGFRIQAISSANKVRKRNITHTENQKVRKCKPGSCGPQTAELGDGITTLSGWLYFSLYQ